MVKSVGSDQTKTLLGTQIGSENDGENNEKELKPEFTQMFFQKQLSFRQAATWFFFHYLSLGMILGYMMSTQFSLQSAGCSYQELSAFSLSTYLFTFKFIFSPFMDRYYSQRFGKSKSYIVPCSLVIGLVFLSLGTKVDTMIKNKQVIPLTIAFSLVNFLSCFVITAGEASVMTIFRDEDKPKAATFMGLGQIFGTVIGFNVFTPLNDVNWLNEYIFTANPLNGPILTHQVFCFIVSSLFLCLPVLVTLFVGERKLVEKGSQSLLWILAIIPRIFTNRHTRGVMIFLFSVRIFCAVDQVIDFKVAKNGYFNMGRSTVSNIDSMVIPFAIFMFPFTVFYTKKGRLMRMVAFTTFYLVLANIFKYINYLDMITNRNYTWAYFGRILASFTSMIDFTGIYTFSFFNLIVNPLVGNTGISCLLSISMTSTILPRSIGLLLTDYMPLDWLVGGCLGLQLLILIIAFPYAIRIDNKPVSVFDISKGSLEEETPDLLIPASVGPQE